MKKIIALIAVIFAVNVQAGEYPDISIADLEKAIKDRVKNLLNATVIDVAPMEERLDEALGEEGAELDA